MASIKKRGDSWLARVRMGNHDESKTFPRKDQATAWARALETKLLEGSHRDLRALKGITVSQMLTRYASEISPNKQGSKRDINRANFLQNYPLAQCLFAELSSTELNAFKHQRLKIEGKKDPTVRKDLALISHLYTVARKEWGYAGLHNPCKDISMPKAYEARKRRLQSDKDEETRLMLAATSVPLLDDLITFAIETGMRREEIATATWSNYNPSIPSLYVPRTKNGEPRDVPLTPLAAKILNGIRARQGKVDKTDTIFGMTVDEISHKFHDACIEAEIEDLRFHDMRHEALSRLSELGLDILSMSEISGHKTLTQLKRYTHPTAKNLAKRLATLKAHEDTVSM